jgi:hypothetical protein
MVKATWKYDRSDITMFDSVCLISQRIIDGYKLALPSNKINIYVYAHIKLESDKLNINIRKSLNAISEKHNVHIKIIAETDSTCIISEKNDVLSNYGFSIYPYDKYFIVKLE